MEEEIERQSIEDVMKILKLMLDAKIIAMNVGILEHEGKNYTLYCSVTEEDHHPKEEE